MPAKLTTKPQVNGYRFMVRRMEHALVRRDVRMLHDPMRSQSRAMTVGLVLGALALAGFGVTALFKPAPTIGDSPIVLAKGSGAMFVKVDDLMHPVLNLASARLIAGSDAAPTVVGDDKLRAVALGPIVGIPGAPQQLPGRDQQVSGPWTVCDAVEGGQIEGTSVIVGPTAGGDGIAPLAGHEGILLEHEGQVHLVRDGQRARVDLDDHAVTRAMGLDGIAPRTSTPALLNAIPEVRPITSQPVPGQGGQPQFAIPEAMVGDVVHITGAESGKYFVVLADGIQRVGAATADLILYSGAGAELRELLPDAIAHAPTTRHPLPVDHHPDRAPAIRGGGDDSVACLNWSRAADAASPRTAILVGRRIPLPDGAQPVSMAGADGEGAAIDLFYLPPGRAANIHVDDGRRVPRFLVADTGVRYGIADAATAQTLGVGADSDSAPWSIVGTLPAGPALTRTDALVARDGMAPLAAAATLESPTGS